MSVKGLSNTVVNIYRVIVSQDAYGANYEQYLVRYTGVQARVRQLKINYENFTDGKEQAISNYRIYLPNQLSVIASDLIVDVIRNRKYDILYVNRTDRLRHMQIDAKRVDTIIGNSIIFPSSSSESSSFSSFTESYSSSSSIMCPNIITGWNSDVIRV